MFCKSIALILLGSATGTAIYAQTPKPRIGAASSSAFSMLFEGGGSYLGVETEEVTKENFAKYGLREVRGVMINNVRKDSPACKAGLRAGDIIVEVDGKAINNEF